MRLEKFNAIRIILSKEDIKDLIQRTTIVSNKFDDIYIEVQKEK